MRRHPTAEQAALLIALAAKRKGDEAGREFARLRLSEQVWRRVTGRRRIDGRFLEDLNAHLEDLNWVVIVTGEAIALISVSSVLGFPRLSSVRIADELSAAGDGTLDYEELATELGRDEVIDDAEGL